MSNKCFKKIVKRLTEEHSYKKSCREDRVLSVESLKKLMHHIEHNDLVNSCSDEQVYYRVITKDESFIVYIAIKCVADVTLDSDKSTILFKATVENDKVATVEYRYLQSVYKIALKYAKSVGLTVSDTDDVFKIIPAAQLEYVNDIIVENLDKLINIFVMDSE